MTWRSTAAATAAAGGSSAASAAAAAAAPPLLTAAEAPPLFTAAEAGPHPPSPGNLYIYIHTLCPYAERAWLALLEKRVPFQLVHIDLSAKPSWFRRINPAGLVPAVQDAAGAVHTESADIVHWVDGAFEGPRLTPEDAGLRAEMEALVRGPCSGAVSAGLDLCAGRGRRWGIGTGQTAAQKAALDTELGQLAASIAAHGGPFLLGPQPCTADILVYPFISRFAVAAPLTGYDVAAAGGGAIGAWLAAWASRPSAAATAADPALLLAAFSREHSLDFFDFSTYRCFQLHPHNAHLLQQP